jgi:hypothetical protein
VIAPRPTVVRLRCEPPLAESGLYPAVLLRRDFDPMAGIEIGEDVPMRIVRVVHRHVHAVAGFVGVFFKREAVILVEYGLAQFAAMGFGDFDFPGRHGIFRMESWG